MHEHHHEENGEELLALIKYMVNHNISHTNELSSLSHQLEEKGQKDAYELVLEAIKLYESGNKKLSEALNSMKEEK